MNKVCQMIENYNPDVMISPTDKQKKILENQKKISSFRKIVGNL